MSLKRHKQEIYEVVSIHYKKKKDESFFKQKRK